LFYC
jgi:hypothetical protein